MVPWRNARRGWAPSLLYSIEDMSKYLVILLTLIYLIEYCHSPLLSPNDVVLRGPACPSVCQLQMWLLFLNAYYYPTRKYTDKHNHTA